MNKLDKLREINAMLNNILIKLETYIFIENIDVDNNINQPNVNTNLN